VAFCILTGNILLMDKIKELAKKGWSLLKAQIIKDWNGNLFSKGKLIFIGGVLLLILIALITK
jgi:hypothetical protein